MFFNTRRNWLCLLSKILEEEKDLRHLRIYMRATSESLHYHRAVRAVLACMYTYIFTRVLTFFEDAVTKTSNHHFSLSLSHNDSHTRFSFLLQLQFACGFDIIYVQGKSHEWNNFIKKRYSFTSEILISPRSTKEIYQIIFKSANLRPLLMKDTANVNVIYVG